MFLFNKLLSGVTYLRVGLLLLYAMYQTKDEERKEEFCKENGIETCAGYEYARHNPEMYLDSVY